MLNSLTDLPTPASVEAASESGSGLICPQCRGVLRAFHANLACDGCAKDYPIIAGIVDLRCHRRDYYFNPVPPNEMEDLLKAISSVPWDESVRRFLRSVKNVPEWIDNVEVDGRYAWKVLLDLPQNARILDFGCGLGNLVHNLAPHAAETFALDLTWERLLFAKERFARHNDKDRIRLVASGDGRFLPFADGFFDGVVLSGVLEWIADDSTLIDQSEPRITRLLQMIGSFFGETNPRKTQIRFLKELRRILKPNGQLFIAIENRWSYEYFMGHPDHHSGLMYGSLLPRLVANLYSIARSHQPYRTYTHSYGGFLRLLSSAGFPKQEFYGLSPGYSGLREIIPAKYAQKLWKPEPPRDLQTRIKRSRYFVPAYGIIAGSESVVPKSLLGRLLDELRDKLETNAAPITVDQFIVTGKDKAVLRGRSGARRLYIKLPLSNNALVAEQNNWAFITELSKSPVTGPSIPVALTRGCYQRVHYFAESAVAGQPLSIALKTVGRPAAAVTVTQWFLGMHAALRPTEAVDSGSVAYKVLVSEPLAKLRSATLDPTQFARLEAAFHKRLDKLTLRLGLTHGDFSSDNILVSEGEISGVIDWGYAAYRGLPVLDMLAYIEGNQRVLEPATTIAENLVRLSRRDWPCLQELDALDQCYRHFDFDPGLHELACELCWLHHMAQQLDTSARFDRERLEINVNPMLRQMLNE
jgi:SAM-dependent methyltransferase